MTPPWLAPGRPVPDLRTEVPGPEARKVLDRDAAVTSPSLPRAYPLVPRRGSGALLERPATRLAMYGPLMSSV